MNEHILKGGALTVAVVGILWAINAGNDLGADTPPDTGVSQGEVWDACKNAVREQLANPDSADFAILSADIAEQSDGWSIVGTVEADNDFGNTAEIAYSCDVDLDGRVREASVT